MAIEEVTEVTNDYKLKNESHSLDIYELENYEFILSLAILFDILVQVNMITKLLQPNTDFQTSTNVLNSLKNFF